MKQFSLASLLVAALPFVAMCFTVALWDRVYPMVLGLPFNLFWLLLWIALTAVCMRVVYWIDTARRRARDARGKGGAQ